MFIQYIRLAATAFAAMLVLASCETSLEVDLPEHETKLVVNGIQKQGEPFLIHLSRSYGFQEVVSESALLVDDATVEIWENGSLLETLVFMDTMVNPYWNWDPEAEADLRLGHYISPGGLIPEVGKTYELRIKHAELGEATGQMTLLELETPVSSAFYPDTITITDIDGYVYYNSVGRFTLPEGSNTSMYYSMKVRGEFPFPWDTTFKDTSSYFLSGSLLNWSQVSAEYNNSNWANINQQGRVLDFAFDNNMGTFINNNGEEERLKPSKIFMEVIATDEATYRYLNGILKQQQADPGNPFYPSEAIVIPSNMSNAYGVFGGITAKEFVID